MSNQVGRVLKRLDVNKGVDRCEEEATCDVYASVGGLNEVSNPWAGALSAVFAWA